MELFNFGAAQGLCAPKLNAMNRINFNRKAYHGKRNDDIQREQPYPSRRGRTSTACRFLLRIFSKKPVLTIRIAAPYPYPIALFASQKQSGGKAMSGGIHSTGFPCLNAAGCCYVPGKGIPCGGMASGQPLKAVHYGNISE